MAKLNGMSCVARMLSGGWQSHALVDFSQHLPLLKEQEVTTTFIDPVFWSPLRSLVSQIRQSTTCMLLGLQREGLSLLKSQCSVCVEMTWFSSEKIRQISLQCPCEMSSLISCIQLYLPSRKNYCLIGIFVSSYPYYHLSSHPKLF